MQLGGEGGQQSQYMVINEQPVEAASPISSRPPASAATGNSDEFMRLASGGDDGAGGGGEDEGDRSGGGAGGGGGGVAGGGNRWPRQETLALLKIRSDMDSTFRDAPVKGPLWEDVSRKLAELGYKRSAKKCREKFENVHKYYKRTKEGRVGRQDGKSYKFFSELEAFHTSPSAATAMDAVPVSAVIPMPTSTTSIPIPTIPTSSSMPGRPVAVPVSAVPPSMSTAAPPITTNTPIATPLEFDFSSNSSSSSQGFNDDDEEEDELGGEPSDTAGTSRKRKRRSGGSSTTKMMMELLEGLMKQVMQKQESLQQRFLEAVDKREQERMSREEAWKRQETLRLTREHELMSQERAIAASRDEAIITFLQKITGQTIQLPTPPPPTTVTIPTIPPLTKPAAVAPVVPPPASIHVTTPPLNQPPPSQQQQQPPPPISSEQMPLGPLQETGGSGSLEPASSRWPKEEVLALINLRSGLDSRYQDVGPKGPLWEEISAGMLRMGYKRNPKRCKEKWENINKYYKKVKESSKKRPEDAKTCPYFHQLDALHRSKMLGGGGSSSFSHGQSRPEEEDISDATLIRQPIDHQSENKTGDTVGEGNGGAAKKETQ